MRRSVLWASFVLLLVVLIVPSIALAQGSMPLPPAPPPTLSTATVVTTVLSLVLGIVTQMVQTGTLLGKWTTPKSWLPTLTIAMTLLGGIVSYLGSQSPLVLNGPTIFYAVIAGIVSLMTGAAPGLAVHAHVVVPENVRAIRSQRVAMAASMATARGFTRMRLVQGLALAGILGLCLVPVVTHSTGSTKEQPVMVAEGCSYWNSSGGAAAGQSAAALGACAILQVVGGVTNVDSIIQACGGVLSAQLVSEIDAILAYYVQAPDAGTPVAATDGGTVAVAATTPMLCGVGTPPVPGAGTCMPQSVITILKNIRATAAARLGDAAAAAH